ncbi:MAG: SDR family oxidoreductase [Candidatus Korarchaeota archaeon]|nr:SDR family oxidoreductase [Candidatus Korarchaeota archaeon]
MADKLAVVTGGSSGLGKAAAVSLLKEGARVLIASRTEERLRRAMSDLSSLGEVQALRTDLTKPDDIESLFRKSEEMGGADILVISYGGPRIARFPELNDRDWYHAYELLVMSVVRLARLFGFRMKERGWGRMVLVTSVAIKEVNMNIPLSTSVRLSLAGLVKVLSRELAPEVNVNAVMPGHFMTERQRDLLRSRAAEKGLSLEEMEVKAAKEIPLARFGRPEELGDVIAFLVSERASYITGSLIPVDGGLLSCTL